MKRQKRSDTTPEQIVRQVLYGLGHRFRLINRDLPGSPDLANRARKWAIFVHGCYWHQHPGCPGATVPKRNRGWWREKFRDNRRRDARNAAALESAGVLVLTIWECETVEVRDLRARLGKALATRLRPRPAPLQDRARRSPT